MSREWLTRAGYAVEDDLALSGAGWCKKGSDYCEAFAAPLPLNKCPGSCARLLKGRLVREGSERVEGRIVQANENSVKSRANALQWRARVGEAASWS